MARVLNAMERRRYDHVRPDTLARARVRRLLWMPHVFQGITLGRHIFITTDEPADGRSALIAHELVHVEQFSDRGTLGFVGWYLADFAKGLKLQHRWMPAYRDITAETEARDATRRWQLRDTEQT